MLITTLCSNLFAQNITGVWRGKINGSNTEIKLIKSGDNLVGVAYYYHNRNAFKRYSIKGHFDPATNSVIWWDEMLLEEKGKKGLLQISADPAAQLMVADFNCPGGEEMYLDGESSNRDNKSIRNGSVQLEKRKKPLFPDEWDFIIDNYLVGTNDPELIDSISNMGIGSKIPEEPSLDAVAIKPGTQKNDGTAPVVTAPASSTPAVTTPAVTTTIVSPPPTEKPDTVETQVVAAPAKPIPSVNETKFTTRKNVLQTVIPITAQTIELRFYDNAQVDGDSIALFLNGKLLFQHIRLTDQPYTIRLNADELGEDNELVMVAENLGSIPPNTSLMVAIVGDKRYEARLFANEQSSAMVRIMRPKPGEQ
ncbi:hypothetical protein HY58_02545 [Flavihumibacter sp. ZG627]|nr:hypothetical protein HY58_02545 [Flavihumibacter sp. ZG627]